MAGDGAEEVSGGSFNYLDIAVDCNGLDGRQADIEEMARALETEGFPEAAQATREVLVMMERTANHARSLAKVWHAVEWHYSADWGKDDMREEIQKWTDAQRTVKKEGNG